MNSVVRNARALESWVITSEGRAWAKENPIPMKPHTKKEPSMSHRYDAMQVAMNKAVEAMEKESGRPMPYESKLVFQYAFCEGWKAIEHRAYKEGILDTQRKGREAIGLYDEGPLP